MIMVFVGMLSEMAAQFRPCTLNSVMNADFSCWDHFAVLSCSIENKETV